MFIWHFLNMFIEMRMAQNFIFHIKLPRILRQQFCYCDRGISWSVHKACLLVGSGSIRSTCKETPESAPLVPQHILVAISPRSSNTGLGFHIDKEVRGQWTVHVTAHDEALWLRQIRWREGWKKEDKQIKEKKFDQHGRTTVTLTCEVRLSFPTTPNPKTLPPILQGPLPWPSSLFTRYPSCCSCA